MISRTGPFIIEEYHLRGTTEFIREIYPHPVLGRPFLIRFSEYLDPAFVTMDISAFQKFLFHQLIQRFQVSVCTVYDPVRHSLCGEIEIISGKLSFLTCQRGGGTPFCFVCFYSFVLSNRILYRGFR